MTFVLTCPCCGAEILFQARDKRQVIGKMLTCSECGAGLGVVEEVEE